MALNFLNNGYFAGKVGIGTESPDYLLDLSKTAVGNTYSGINLQASNYGYTIEGGLTQSAGGELRFSSNNAGTRVQRVIFTATGSVGIGTTQPYGKLDIKIDTDNVLSFRDADTWGGYAGAAGIISLNANSSNTKPLEFYASGYNFKGGNVGIGTDNPAQDLTLYRSSGDTNFLISSNNGASQIFFGDTESDNIGKIDYDHSDNSLNFAVNAAERMRITSAGNVGIGVTGPVGKLDVFTTTVQNGSTPGIKLMSSNTQQTVLLIGNTGTRNYEIAVGGTTSSTPGALYVYDGNQATYRLTLQTTGQLTLNAYNSTNNTGTPTYLLGTDASGNVVKTNTVPGSDAGPYVTIGTAQTITGVKTFANVGYLGDGTGSVQYTLQSSNTGYGTIDFGDVADSNIGRLSYNHNDNSFLIRTNNATALTLDASQNATFAGTGTFSGSTASGVLTLESTAASDLTITTTGANTWEFNNSGNNSVYNAYSHTFKNGSTLGLTINDSGDATFAGNIMSTQGGTAALPKITLSGSTTTGIYTPVANGWGVSTNGVSSLTIDASQNATFAGDVSLGNAKFIKWGNGNQQILGNNTSGLSLYSNGERMRILTNGNVGIGTTSPGTKLQVGTGSGATVDTAYQIVADGSAISGIQILSGATQSGRLVFGDSGNNDIGIIKYDHSDNSLQTIVNAAERMRITSAGNVGIGTTSPDFKLDVDGTLGVSDLPFNSSSVSVLVADETIGAETITNGDFATDSDWTKSSNVSISGGQATFTANSAAQYIIQGSLWPANSLSGQKVKLTYTIVSNSLNAGNFRIGGYTGASAFTLNGLVTTVGTHNIILDVRTTAGDDNAIDLYITSSATSGALVIDNVSVKQVTSASDQIQKRELGTGAFGPTPVGAYLPLAGGTMTGDITISKLYPKLLLNDTTGVARKFSVGTNNETFTVRNETGSVDSLTISNSNNATFAGNITFPK